MVYPRRCPLCRADYTGGAPPVWVLPGGRVPANSPAAQAGGEGHHATLRAVDGGTRSPWRPDRPGRLLALQCRTCGGEYGWDYFGSCPAVLDGGAG